MLSWLKTLKAKGLFGMGQWRKQGVSQAASTVSGFGESIASTSDSKDWMDHISPRISPFLRLMRLHHPIGTWLLLWPCLWSVALAFKAASFPGNRPFGIHFAGSTGGGVSFFAFHGLSGSFQISVLFVVLVLLFGLGAILMRGAGCVYNDILDRDIDRHVARTRNRPLARGDVDLRSALLFLFLLLFLAFGVLSFFNPFTRALGWLSLPIVAAYPLMKRMMPIPQLVLGLAFNWGALMGWSAVFGGLHVPPVLLYIAGIFWTLFYDTVYAHQDIRDDALLGLGSSALLLRGKTKRFLSLFAGLSFLFLVLAGLASGLGLVFLGLMLPVGAHWIWQILRLREADEGIARKLFLSNAWLGALVMLAFSLGGLLP